MGWGAAALEEQSAERVRRVLVLVNRRAGGVRRRPWLARELRRAVGSRGEVAVTNGPHELPSVLKAARASGVDTIAICGGDGSNTAALTAMASVWRDAPWPRIALLQGGTVNTASGSLHLGGRPPERLTRLLDAPEPLVLKRPLLDVNGRLGFIFGTAMPCRVLDAYYSGPLGPVGCVLTATRILASVAVRGPFARRLFAAEPIRLEVDGAQHPIDRTLALVAATVPVVAVGMRATRRAAEDGGFHLVAIQRPPWRNLHEAPALWLGLPAPNLLGVDVLARRARLQMPPAARYTLDGDIFDGSDLELRSTRPVDIVAPPPD